MDRLDIEVHVIDENGHPLAGSVIWYVSDPHGPDGEITLDPTAMSRMARRYASQSDFLNVDDLPKTSIGRADLKGVYRDFREIKNAPALYPYIFVATKRGYLPRVVEGTARLNERHIVSLKLKLDPKAKPEPRMEEFDRLVAQARSPVPGEDLVGEARMEKLDELNQQTRALARALEKEGLSDQASAVYWALADFPDVVRITSADGQTKAVGYRNGRTDAQSDDDRTHATQLNSTVPKLLIEKRLASQGFRGKGIHDANKGLAYLKIFDELSTGPMGEKILPWEYQAAIAQALKWSTPDYACGLLQRAFRFEPAMMGVSRWWKYVDRVQMQSAALKLPPQACVIEGLPARPSKVQGS